MSTPTPFASSFMDGLFRALPSSFDDDERRKEEERKRRQEEARRQQNEAAREALAESRAASGQESPFGQPNSLVEQINRYVSSQPEKVLDPAAQGASRDNPIALPGIIATARRDGSPVVTPPFGSAGDTGPFGQSALVAALKPYIERQEHTPAVQPAQSAVSRDAVRFMAGTDRGPAIGGILSRQVFPDAPLGSVAPTSPGSMQAYEGDDQSYRHGTDVYESALRRRSDFLRESAQLRALDSAAHSATNRLFLDRTNYLRAALDPNRTVADYDLEESVIPKPSTAEAVAGTLGSYAGMALPFSAESRVIDSAIDRVAPSVASTLAEAGMGGRMLRGAAQNAAFALQQRGALDDPDILTHMTDAGLIGAAFGALPHPVPLEISEEQAARALANAPAHIRPYAQDLLDIVREGGDPAEYLNRSVPGHAEAPGEHSPRQQLMALLHGGEPPPSPRYPSVRSIRFNHRMDESLGVPQPEPSGAPAKIPDTNAFHVEAGTRSFPHGAPTFDAVGGARDVRGPEALGQAGATPFHVLPTLAGAGIGAATGAAANPDHPLAGALAGGVLVGAAGGLGSVLTERALSRPVEPLVRRIPDTAFVPELTEAAVRQGGVVLNHYADPSLKAAIDFHPETGTYTVLEMGGVQPRAVTGLRSLEDANATARAMGFVGEERSHPLLSGSPTSEEAERASVAARQAAGRAFQSGETLPLATPEPNPAGAPKGMPLPLPPLHPSLDAGKVKGWWDVVSARYPRLASMVRSIDVLDDAAPKDAGAAWNAQSRGLLVPPGGDVSASVVFHELAHAAQTARGRLGALGPDGASPLDYETWRELEDYAYRVQVAHQLQSRPAYAAQGEAQPIDGFFARALNASRRLLGDQGGAIGSGDTPFGELPASWKPNAGRTADTPAQARAFHLGQDAGAKGLSHDVNPYLPETREWRDFERGWNGQRSLWARASSPLRNAMGGVGDQPEQVTAAAFRAGGQVYPAGFGGMVHAVPDNMPPELVDGAEQGFITNRGRFVTREEAATLHGLDRPARSEDVVPATRRLMDAGGSDVGGIGDLSAAERARQAWGLRPSVEANPLARGGTEGDAAIITPDGRRVHGDTHEQAAEFAVRHGMLSPEDAAAGNYQRGTFSLRTGAYSPEAGAVGDLSHVNLSVPSEPSGTNAASRLTRGAAGAALGAGIGAGADEDNRLRGALTGGVLGAGAGFLAPEVRSAIEGMYEGTPARHLGRAQDMGAFNPHGSGLERFTDGDLRQMAQRYDGDPAQEAILAELKSREATAGRHAGDVDRMLTDADRRMRLTPLAARLPDGYTIVEDGALYVVRDGAGRVRGANQNPEEAVRNALTAAPVQDTGREVHRYVAEPLEGGRWRVTDTSSGRAVEDNIGGFDARTRAEGIAARFNRALGNDGGAVGDASALNRVRSSTEGVVLYHGGDLPSHLTRGVLWTTADPAIASAFGADRTGGLGALDAFLPRNRNTLDLSGLGATPDPNVLANRLEASGLDADAVEWARKQDTSDGVKWLLENGLVNDIRNAGYDAVKVREGARGLPSGVPGVPDEFDSVALLRGDQEQRLGRTPLRSAPGQGAGAIGAANNQVLRAVAGAGAGGLIGATRGDDARSRLQNALLGAAAGAGVGLAPEVIASIRRVAGNSIGAVGDITRIPVEVREATPESGWRGRVVPAKSWPPEAYLHMLPDGTAELHMDTFLNPASRTRAMDAFDGAEEGMRYTHTPARVQWDGASGIVTERGSLGDTPNLPTTPEAAPQPPAGPETFAPAPEPAQAESSPVEQAPPAPPPPVKQRVRLAAATEPTIETAEPELNAALNGKRPDTRDVVGLASGTLSPEDFATRYGIDPQPARNYARAAQNAADDPAYNSPLDDPAYAHDRPDRGDWTGQTPPEPRPVDTVPDDGFLAPDKPARRYGSGGGQAGLRFFPNGPARTVGSTLAGAAAGAGIGALANPDDRMRGAEIGAGIGGTLGALSPGLQAVSAARRAGLLTNVSGIGRDVLQNALPTETLSRVIASPADLLLSQFSGQRSVIVSPVGAMEAAYRGVTTGSADMVRKAMGRPVSELGRAGAVAAGRAVEGSDVRIMANPYWDMFVRTVGQLRGSVDMPTAVASYVQAIDEQARLIARNEGLRGRAYYTRVSALKEAAIDIAAGREVPEELHDLAQRANANAGVAVAVSTLTNDNFASDRLKDLRSGIQNWNPKGANPRLLELGKNLALGVTDFVAPFKQVPGALAGMTVQMSPLGYAKAGTAFVEWVKALRSGATPEEIQALQRAATMSGGRATLGSGIIAGGALLAKHGYMTGSHPTADQRKDGAKPFSVHVLGRWVPIGELPPVGALMAFGAEWQLSGARSGVGELGKNVVGLTLARATGDVQDIIGATGNRKQDRALNSIASSFVPTVVGQVAQGMDGAKREPANPLQAIEARIPGLVDNVPAAIDPATGQAVRTGPGGVSGAVSRVLDFTRSQPSQLRVKSPGTALLEANGTDVSKIRRRRAETDQEYSVRLSDSPNLKRRQGESPSAYRKRNEAWKRRIPDETDEQYRTRQSTLGEYLNRSLSVLGSETRPDNPWMARQWWALHGGAEAYVRRAHPNLRGDAFAQAVADYRTRRTGYVIGQLKRSFARARKEDPELYFAAPETP